jgi:mycothiol maleylpyruvate isomerase-like protein
MPWFGPPMSPTSMATARFMETWAHGLDVYAALGIDPEITDLASGATLSHQMRAADESVGQRAGHERAPNGSLLGPKTRPPHRPVPDLHRCRFARPTNHRGEIASAAIRHCWRRGRIRLGWNPGSVPSCSDEGWCG